MEKQLAKSGVQLQPEVKEDKKRKRERSSDSKHRKSHDRGRRDDKREHSP